MIISQRRHARSVTKKKRIESLTPDQIAQLAVYRDRWIAIGLSTEPADRQKAEESIRLAYQAGGMAIPRRIVWCQSPLSQGLTRAVVLQIVKRASVRASVRDSVGDSVRASVRASVWDQLGASGRACEWDCVRA